MPDVTLAQAQAQLDAWLAASLKIAAKGQSYTIDTPNGQRVLTRADLGEVQKMITYWRGEVQRLTPASTSGVPRGPIYLGF